MKTNNTDAKPTHTPGPWKLLEQLNDGGGTLKVPYARFFVDTADGHTVVELNGKKGSIVEANARLIAAAPETAAERDELAKVLGRVLDKCRDFLKKKDYELYREAANRQEVAILRATEGK